MATPENQDIILYVPKSNVLTAVFVGFCLPIGFCLPFFAGWQLPILLGSLFLIAIGGGFAPFMVWRMLHNPILTINSEGIFSRDSFQVKWEEIDSIYSLNARSRGAFAMDISSTGVSPFFSRRGMHIPKWMDVTVPQQALVISSSNLPLPVDQILALIRERFPTQLECYTIHVDDGHTESQEPS